MAFTNNFRIERIYFEKLKSNIDILKSYIEAGATGEALELLKNSVDVDGAVLLLYRNLGEAWAELADLIQKTQKDLKDLAEKTEAYHDELNERIDDVNNYLMMLIRELDARLQVVEQDLATMNRNKYYDLVENNGSYLIEKDGETVYFDDIKEDVDFPHNVILRYDSGTGTVELEVREFTDSRIDFYSIGLADSDKTVKEILVSIADTEAVTYSENTLENPLYTFGTGLSLDSDNELSVDFNTVQAKLSEGFGIDIDSNNEIKVDTTEVQEKLIAGNNITLTPDSTDPTKTVIGASGGTNYSAGAGIDITNNKISIFEIPIYSGDTRNVQTTLTNKNCNLSTSYSFIYYYCLQNFLSSISGEDLITLLSKAVAFAVSMYVRETGQTIPEPSGTYKIAMIKPEKFDLKLVDTTANKTYTFYSVDTYKDLDWLVCLDKFSGTLIRKTNAKIYKSFLGAQDCIKYIDPTHDYSFRAEFSAISYIDGQLVERGANIWDTSALACDFDFALYERT